MYDYCKNALMFQQMFSIKYLVKIRRNQNQTNMRINFLIHWFDFDHGFWENNLNAF